jgi:acetyl-CoA C-acetyltransferase
VDGEVTDPRAPCVIGAAQHTFRPDAGEAPEPLRQWEAMCREAATDSGAPAALAAVDSLNVVYSLSWQYDDAAGRLAERLGLPDGDRRLSGLSGTAPQHLLQSAAAEILAGRREAALVVGGEALATKKRLKREGRRPAWSFPPAERRPPPFDDPFHPAEIAHEVFQAYLSFAVFDLARRAHLGLSPQENRRQVARLLASMTGIAAKNPFAWFPVERSEEEIRTPTPTNRTVAYPYTKHMISFMDVDMAAAVLVTSHEKAEALGVPAERRVYLRGWSYARDPVYVAERDELWRSRAMEEASRQALAGAGVGLDDITYLDLYSCFGSSVNFARDALGLAEDDPRPLTVTGGLPYFGGPGNNTLTHAIATMVGRLRSDPAALGMVSGVGMHMTHHVFGVYSATPGAVAPPDAAAVQSRVSEAPVRPIRNPADGPATIAAYSVVHGREGPAWGLAVCDLPGGDRAYARTRDAALLASMEQEEWVGRPVTLRSAARNVNVIEA